MDQNNIVTIEDLRVQMGSCFTCGVSWTDDHVSLDCSECGGYGLERPCPLCDGCCGTVWKRDFTMVSSTSWLQRLRPKLTPIVLPPSHCSLTRLGTRAGWAAVRRPTRTRSRCRRCRAAARISWAFWRTAERRARARVLRPASSSPMTCARAWRSCPRKRDRGRRFCL